MNTIHPHWRATDEDVPVTIREHHQPHAELLFQPKTVSRRPAAILGIAAVLTGGYFLFSRTDTSSLQGQVSTPLGISITDSGFVPDTLTVKAGDTLLLVNDSIVPQIVESDTLCSSTNYCLYTTTLFPGESEQFSITQEFAPGTYTFSSSSLEGISGTIIIEGQIATQPLPLAPFPTPATTTPIPTAPENYQFQSVTTSIEQSITGTGQFDPSSFAAAPPSAADAFANSLVNQLQPVGTASIPQNPYALGSDRVHPFDASGDPVPSAFGENVHSGAPKPISQPKTGAGLWVVIVMTAIGIWIAVRRSMRNEVLYAQI